MRRLSSETRIFLPMKMCHFANDTKFRSSEVKNAWKQRNYKQYNVNLKLDTDKEIIDYIEANKERFGTTEIFRAAMEMLIKNGGI